MTGVLFITGASSGIGAATARLWVQGGGKVTLFARSAGKIAEMVTELGSENVLGCPGDVTDSVDLERAVDRTIAKFGKIDGLFANAGISQRWDLVDGDPNDWARMVDVNINGVLRSIRAVLRYLVEQKSGDILITASRAGRAVYPGNTVYSSTKHAVYAIAQGLRAEVHEHGIRVGVVSPGFVANGLWGITDSAEIKQEVDAQTGLSSEDVASVVVNTLRLPRNVSIADMLILPTRSSIIGM